MDGAQDMGGIQGYGPVEREENEPVFHADWERRAFAVTLAMARPGGWTIDMSRFAREDRPPPDYLRKSYYEIWLSALERLAVARDLIGADECEAGRVLHPPKPVPVLRCAEVAAMLRRGGPTQRAPTTSARFVIGQKVRTRIGSPPTHTRLPRYARGRMGTIALVHGVHVFPDTNASGAGEDPQWLYAVTFDGRDLWGDDGDPAIRISIDAFEPYLDPA